MTYEGFVDYQIEKRSRILEDRNRAKVCSTQR